MIKKQAKQQKNGFWSEKILQKKKRMDDFETIKSKIDELLSNPFYRIAPKFGWQGTVIESYRRQNK